MIIDFFKEENGGKGKGRVVFQNKKSKYIVQIIFYVSVLTRTIKRSHDRAVYFLCFFSSFGTLLHCYTPFSGNLFTVISRQ